MRPLAAVALLLSLAVNVNGLYESQAGIIDWHKPYIGIPRLTRWTSPRFHRIASTQANIPAKAIVVVGTQKNVVAALNPSDGGVGTFYPLTRTAFDVLTHF
jgi:ER membrane protein complex subunit 1